ncbi:glycosyl hydrolase family 18 protein [Streptomyces rectiverticillatus]|uniref:glycosyl hydrolase family 18 protein n=1 Tax=Streptomyces rectiverticillatus TaxID=173860 RepID=UPI0015C2EDE8|nr:glycosyl hydrolase family 18 protein [Streptomyces rectiverticillatus]
MARLDRLYSAPYRGPFRITRPNVGGQPLGAESILALDTEPRPRGDRTTDIGVIIRPGNAYIMGFYVERGTRRDVWYLNEQYTQEESRWIDRFTQGEGCTWRLDYNSNYNELRGRTENYQMGGNGTEYNWPLVNQANINLAIAQFRGVPTAPAHRTVTEAGGGVMVMAVMIAEAFRDYAIRTRVIQALEGEPDRDGNSQDPISQNDESAIRRWNRNSTLVARANAEDPDRFAQLTDPLYDENRLRLAVLHRGCDGLGLRGPRSMESSSEQCPTARKPIQAAVAINDYADVLLFNGPNYQRLWHSTVTIGGKSRPSWRLSGAPDAVRSISEDVPALRGTVFVNGIDAAIRLPGHPNDLLLFRGDQYLRLSLDKAAARQGLLGGTVATGPMKISEAFRPLSGTVFADGLDTGVAVDGNNAYIFKGDQYALVGIDIDGTGDKLINGPKKIADNWSALRSVDFLKDLDAAFYAPVPEIRWRGPTDTLPEPTMGTVFIKNGAYVTMKVNPGTVDDESLDAAGQIDTDWGDVRRSVFSAGEGALRIPTSMRRPPKEISSGQFEGLAGKCLDVRDGSRDNGTAVRLHDCNGSSAQNWSLPGDGTVRALGLCLDADHSGKEYGTKVQLWGCNGSEAQKWTRTDAHELKNVNADLCLDVPGSVSDDGRQLQLWGCNGSDAQKWVLDTPSREDEPRNGGDAGDPFDDSADDRGTKPASSGDCRPEGMTPTKGVSARYCDVYDGSGREWVGKDRTRRVVGYFTGWRAGTNGDPKYLVSNIPWSKVSHINYAFARVDDDRISIGDPSDAKNPATGMTWDGAKNAMDPSLPYKGHFNLLNTYKKKHPAVKTLISVGGWADTRNFYTMTTNGDGSVNQAGIDTFADSVTGFLDRYGFNGVDIDYEYPTALPNTGNPKDWDVSNPRRKGLQQGYNALIRTLREKLDKAGSDKGRYYQLTSAGSSSGYLVRGLDAGQALQYQDFVNVMTYDLHGSWNKFVGPQAPLYDDGKDNELADAGIYDDKKADTKDFQKHGYFNTDWAYHYYRGALPAGRINLGIPYYSRGWRDVQGGSDGLWGTAAMPDQSKCPEGTGGRGPANAQSCGLGAVGIDNLWHDTEDGREVGAGSNPLWHTKNLQDGVTPGYLGSYGVKDGKLTGTYAEKYSDALESPWLWNDAKKVFLSTENERSVDAKAKYIADKGIGGAMVWELAGDYGKRSNGEWGMGYDLTTRLDNAFKGAGAYGNARAGGRAQPREVIDVRAELVEFPTGKDDFYPVQPKLRITNDSKVPLGRGTEISFDLPTSTPPVVKDNDYKEIKGLTPGHTGPNAGGLKGDFHRLTFKLGYCEDLPPGTYRDIDLKYYLPITGPANVTFKIGDKEFGSTGDRRRDVGVVDPPAPASGDRCQAADYTKGQVYRPDGGRLWRMYDKGDKGWMFEYGDSPSGRPMMIDNNPDQSRVHLVELGESNPNQYWRIRPAGDGLFTIAGGDRCMTAADSRQDVASVGCDGRAEPKWRLVPIADNGSEGAPGGPRHNGLFKLRSATGDHDVEVANGATARETHIVSGDPAASTAAFVKHDGWYWYAQWYTTVAPGEAESNGGKPWKRLGPAAA